MKKSILAIILLCCHTIAFCQKPKYIYVEPKTKSTEVNHTVSQETKEPDLRTYLSKYLVLFNADRTSSKKETTIKIIFLDPKSGSREDASFAQRPIGFISLDFINRNEGVQKFTIKYMKKSVEKDGLTHWYVIIDYTEDYDVVKITKMKKPITLLGKSYTQYFTLAKYGSQTKPYYEMILFCNRL